MEDLSFDAFTDQQMREIAQEMARIRFSYLSTQTKIQLLDPTFLRQKGISSNDVTQMTRQDFKATIRLLTSFNVPIPSYHRYCATYGTQEVEVESLNETSAAYTATDLLDCQLYQLSLQEIKQSEPKREGA